MNEEIIRVLQICLDSLATYGQHPIIESQVKQLMQKLQNDVSIPVGKRVSPMLAEGNKIDCNNCYECLKNKTDGHGLPIPLTRMILCPTCGNKRCPKATDHNLECTNSNESGQAGSRY